MRFKRVTIGILLVGMGFWPAWTVADEADQAKNEVTGLWNVELMMRQAAENISRRYNLNEKQREYTQELLTERVTNFLDTHPEIWPLIRDLTRHQLQGEAPDGDMARRIGQAAQPLLAEIREEILESNRLWREILTPEQQKMHDWDLRDMDRTFAKMEENFEAMSEGHRVNQGVFPPPNTEEPQPQRPPQPSPKYDFPPPEQSIRERPQEDWWDTYVQEFIRKYRLDEAQSDAALSILRECKQRARDYRNSKEKEFLMVSQRLQEARQPGQSMDVRKKKLEVFEKLEKTLNQPILDLFEELKTRLDRIPTDAQKERADGKSRRTRHRTQPDATPEKSAKPAATPEAGTAPSPTPEAQSEATPAPVKVKTRKTKPSPAPADDKESD